MKALEKEVVRLREVERRMVWEEDALQARVGFLEQTLSSHAIPVPTATDHNLTASIDDAFCEQTANVTLRNDSNGQVLRVEMPSFASHTSTGPSLGANASSGNQQVPNTNLVDGATSSNNEGNGRG